MRVLSTFLLGLAAAALVGAGCPGHQQAKTKPTPMKGGEGSMAPSGLHVFTQAKAKNSHQPDRLGGPITVSVSQTNGKARFNLPGTRRLDSAVFGSPAKPAGFEPAPFPMLGISDGNNKEGHPWRLKHGARYTIVNHFSPFSDWYVPTKASVNMTVTDAQAIDGAKTRDKIDFEATFELPDGAKYRVVVKMALPHGKAFPTFGGVVTNHLIHGSANIAPKLLPTTYAYVAFWGAGSVYKNGQLMKDRDGKLVNMQLVHVWVNERIRGKGDTYRLDSEAGGPSAGKTLHMIVAPYRIVPGKGPVKSPLFTMYKPFGLVRPNVKRESQAAKKSGDPYDLERTKHMREVAKHTKQHVIHATMEGEMGAMPFILIKFDEIRIKVNK